MNETDCVISFLLQRDWWYNVVSMSWSSVRGPTGMNRIAIVLPVSTLSSKKSEQATTSSRPKSESTRLASELIESYPPTTVWLHLSTGYQLAFQMNYDFTTL